MIPSKLRMPVASRRSGSLPDHLGAAPIGQDQTSFLVWAPLAASVAVHVVYPEDRVLSMTPLERGYWGAVLSNCPPGTRYFYRLNGQTDRPDPASRLQPESVHGPSEVVAPPEKKASGWKGIPLQDYVLYELHTGTFTPEGTLDAIIPHLPRLKSLGITAVELMPVAAFPGTRNWGYDGVYPFAVQASYGGIHAMRRLVDACHQIGLAVVLDVVYNHLGPEGNYLPQFGPYFITCYRTPWGDALNFDGPDSDEVRRYFIENALYWIADCGVDALRLDAVHAIHDRSAYPFLQELGERVHEYAALSGRNVYLIAESDLNDARLLRPVQAGGFGLDAQWADDFHHCLHTLLTGEDSGYYSDFGTVRQFAAAMQEGWVYSGQYSKARRLRFGNSPAALDADQLVVFSQNHDQAGNRMCGERLVHLVGFAGARLAAAAVILSPYLPLLFMGEEYGEPAPFLYHTSHTDPDLHDAVIKGRNDEFAAFRDQGEPPDPQAEETFLASKLNQHLVSEGMHARLYRWYSELLRLRKTHPALRALSKQATVVEFTEESRTVLVRRLSHEEQILMVLNFGPATEVPVYLPRGEWSVLLDSCAPIYGGGGETLGVDTTVHSEGHCVHLSVTRFGCVVFAGKVEGETPDHAYQ